jgi:hypothetical protein
MLIREMTPVPVIPQTLISGLQPQFHYSSPILPGIRRASVCATVISAPHLFMIAKYFKIMNERFNTQLNKKLIISFSQFCGS